MKKPDDVSTRPESGDGAPLARLLCDVLAEESESGDEPEASDADGRDPDPRHSRQGPAIRAEAAVVGARSAVGPLGLSPGARVSHYEVIRSLGRGGHGQVYLARDTRLGRLVALKFLMLASKVRVERFMAEARVTARFKHENVVTLHELGTHGRNPYMVLEYVEGQTLREWLDERISRMAEQRQQYSLNRDKVSAPARATGVSASLATDVMVPVVQALCRSHELGIVHRDLKPSNIMFSDAGTIKVLDFGIAKLVDVAEGGRDPAALESAIDPGDRKLTRTGTLIGTLMYMAPEQWRAGEIDARTDLWAVGLILYELLRGRHPLEPLTRERLATIADLDIPMPRLSEEAPELGRMAAIVDRLLHKRKSDRFDSAAELLTALTQTAGTARRGRPGEAEVNPYPGLHSFQESDADRFFGREREVNQVIRLLGDRPLLAVVGPSGAGKSSFVRAGLIPALKRGGESWAALVMRPGPRPMAAMAELLLHRFPHRWSEAETAAEITDEITERPLSGVLASGDRESVAAELGAAPGRFGTLLRTYARRRLERVLLFVDQFEELYTMASSEDRARFLACLGAVADDIGSPLRVVVSMRSDFIDRMASEPGIMAERIARGMTLLRPMDRDGMRAALVRPLQPTGYRFENDDMVEEMLDTLEDSTGALPLLQFAASRLWEIRTPERHVLGEEGYRRLGGVAGTLAQHADAVVSAMSSADGELMRAVMLRLVTPERTRALVTMGELRESIGATAAAIERVLGRLIDARLLTSDSGGDSDSTDSMVEIVHESLIDKWPTLGRWLDDHEEDGAFLAKLRPAAAEWQRSGRDDGFLWTGAAAREAEIWYERRGSRAHGGLGRREKAFLLAAIALAERARVRRRRLLVAGVSALAAVAVVVSYLAVRASREAARVRAQKAVIAEREAAAQEEARRARNATRMAKAHEYLADPTTVLALLREVEPPSMPRGWADLAWQTLHDSVAEVVLTHDHPIYHADIDPAGRRIVTAGDDGVAWVWPADDRGEPVALVGHEQSVTWASFDHDGRRVVTASIDRTARIWNADGSGAPVILRGHEDALRSAAFSPDGRRVVTASKDRTVRVWNADGSGAPIILGGHRDEVWSAAFSPDGRRIVSASYDKTARIWSADGAGEPEVLRGHEANVLSAAFSPDGKRIVTASVDRTARIWSVAGARQERVLRGHTDMVYSAAFSGDGRHVVTASPDRTARVWRADGSAEPIVLRGHGELLGSARFTPDGRVLTASEDGTARIWSMDDQDRTVVIPVSDTWVFTAVFSPDGTRLAVCSQDGVVRVRDLAGATTAFEFSHAGNVREVVFSPDGRRVATASWDKTAQIHRVDRSSAGSGSDTDVPVVLAHPDAVFGVAFTPDGRRLLTACGDGKVRLWPADGSGEPEVIAEHQQPAWSVAISPDGKRALSTSLDGTVKVWPLDRAAGARWVYRGHRDTVWSAVFSPDGERVASASQDRTVHIFRADGRGEAVVLEGHGDAIYRVAFSPDGRRVASASGDKTIRLWSADGTGSPLVLRGHREAVNGVAFSPDGARIASASQDGTARIFTDLDPVAPDDPRLWQRSGYCMPIARRRHLLDVGERRARADHQTCLRRTSPGADRPSADRP